MDERPSGAGEPWGTGAWRGAWDDRRFRWGALATAAALGVTLAAFTRFVAWVEDRPGVVLDDPLLRRLPVLDLNLPTFALIYGSLALALVLLVPRPERLLLAVRAYVLLVLMRMLVMALTPLDPPTGIVPLADPLVEGLGTGRPLTRDLFFSGHVGTGFVLALSAPRGAARRLLGLATATVGACTLLQHVHYTVDVVAAPVFAYVAWRGAHRLSRPGAASAADVRSL